MQEQLPPQDTGASPLDALEKFKDMSKEELIGEIGKLLAQSETQQAINPEGPPIPPELLAKIAQAAGVQA